MPEPQRTQKQVAEKVKKSSAANYKDPITTEIVPFKKFYVAEDYHQDYLQKNPGGYNCHVLRD